ncbi:MAG: hypothetical protein WA021_05375 [Minisyncoccia bacterium]
MRHITGEEPAAYRGVAGLPFHLERYPTDDQKRENWRIETDACAVLKSSPSVDEKERGRRQEALLLVYFTKWVGDTANWYVTLSRRSAFFNLSKKEADAWRRTSSGKDPFKIDTMVMHEADLTDDLDMWAVRVRDCIRSLGFILRTQMPKGAEYRTDIWTDVRSGKQMKFGTMTSLDEAYVAKNPMFDLIDTVWYKHTKYSSTDERIQPILEALFRFQNSVVEKLQHLTPETTMEDVLVTMRAAYATSGLATALERGVAEKQGS